MLGMLGRLGSLPVKDTNSPPINGMEAVQANTIIFCRWSVGGSSGFIAVDR